MSNGISLDEVILDSATSSVTVVATDLDIRDLAFGTDSVDVSDSEVSLDATTLAALENITVSATDLDIRDLINTQDSIAIGDATNIFDVSIMDSAFDVLSNGFPIMGIRQDGAGSPVSATGDAHPLVFDGSGQLKVATSLTSSVGDDDAYTENPIAVGGRGVSGALTALSATGDKFDLLGDLYRRVWVNDSANIAILNSAATVTGTAAQVLASPLAGRRFVTIQNEGSQDVYLGSSAGVTSANGIKLTKANSATYEWGPDIDIYMISATGSQSVRFLESA